MCWNSKLFCRLYSVILSFFKKTTKKTHPCRHLVELSAGRLGVAGWGDYPQFWILNCNIENRLFSVITERNVLYRFFSLLLFLILPFDGPTAASRGCVLKISALSEGHTGVFPPQDGDLMHDESQFHRRDGGYGLNGQ